MKRKRISFFKKLKLFREFRRVIKLHAAEIEERFGARIDNAYRIYNVINIPIENVGEPYNLRKSDIDKIAETAIKEYSTEMSKFLNDKGLSEMYGFYDIKKVEKYSYLVVIGFTLSNSPFRSHVYYNNIIYRLIPTIVILSAIAFLLFYLL